MRLVKFIDNRFQELRLLEQADETKAEYSIYRDSETLALQSVLKMLRTTTKWLLIPKVLIHYICVLLGISRAPEPVLINKVKEDIKKEQATKVSALKPVDLPPSA